MTFNLLIKYSFNALSILVFLIVPLFFYNMVVVGSAGHSVGGNGNLFFFLVYSLLLFFILLRIRKTKHKVSYFLMRLSLAILLIPLAIYLLAILNYIFKEGFAWIFDFIVFIISTLMLASIFFVFIGVILNKIPSAPLSPLAQAKDKIKR